MLKIFKYIIPIILLVSLSMTILVACKNNKNDIPQDDTINQEQTEHIHVYEDGLCECGAKNPSEMLSHGAFFKNFEAKVDEIIGVYYVLDEARVDPRIDLNQEIETTGDLTWKLFNDIECSDIVENLEVDLKKGENVFYVLIEGESEPYIHKIVINYTAMHVVNFDDMESVFVKDGECVSPIELHKEGYALVKWDYDFSKPITEDVFVIGVWEPVEYTFYFVDPNGNTIVEPIKVKYNELAKLPDSEDIKEEFDVYAWEFGGVKYELGGNFTCPNFDVYFHPWVESDNTEVQEPSTNVE